MSKSKKNSKINSDASFNDTSNNIESVPNLSNDAAETSNSKGGHFEIVLEKNVPIPAIRAKVKYPFDKMSPGDSFVINKKTNAASVTVAYWKKKLPGTDYTVRAIDENSTRVWRIDGVGDTKSLVTT